MRHDLLARHAVIIRLVVEWAVMVALWIAVYRVADVLRISNWWIGGFYVAAWIRKIQLRRSGTPGASGRKNDEDYSPFR